MRRLLVLAFAIFLAACVATVPKSSLRPVSGDPLHLATPLTVVPQSGPTEGVSLTLMPGEYVPVLTNTLGTFFRGPKHAIVQKQPRDKRTFLREGGIWLPASGSNPGPRIYVYDGLPTVLVDSPSGPRPDNPIASPTAFPLHVPPNASLGTVGVGAALGVVIVAAMIQIDETDVLFITDALPAELQIETRFLKSRP